MRSFLVTVEHVRAWVVKKGGKSCEWRISDVGRPSEDDWNPYIDAGSLPLGKKLTLRVKGSKGTGVDVCIASVAIADANFCDKCGKDRSEWEADLQGREKKLGSERVEFVEWMSEQNMFLIKNKIGTKDLDAKTRAAVKEYYDIVFDSEQRLREFVRNEDALLSRAQKAENYHEISAQVNWTINRLANLYGLGKIKKMEDIPSEWVERFQAFLLHEVSVEHLSKLPHAAKRLAMDVTRLPKDQLSIFMNALGEWMNGQGI